jgi:hypothetical protein
MQQKHFINSLAVFILLTFCKPLYAQELVYETAKPQLYINDFKKNVDDGLVLNCRKMKDFGVRVFLNEKIAQYEMFRVELHRFGAESDDDLMAYKKFIPAEKEFKKKYTSKTELNLFLFIPENDGYFTSDFELNTLLFRKDNYVNDVFCTFKEKENNSYYLVMKGYMKTGRKNKFDEDIWDKGKEISPRSIVFKNHQP